MREFPAGWRVVAVETFELEAGEPPYDIALAVRVGALNGRNQDAEAPAKRRIAAALTPHGRDSHEHFAGHDQAAATRDWRYVAGVSFQLTEAMSVEMSYGDFLSGANTHSARVISLGWSWGFSAFGVPTLGGGFR